MFNEDIGIVCPSCGGTSNRVTDSRPAENGGYTRRRKLCACGEKFTTQEIVVARGETAVATNRAALAESIIAEITARLPRIVATAVNQTAFGKADA